MHRVALPVATLLAASLVLAGCGGDDSTDDGDQNVRGGSTLSSTWPLTGEPVTGDGSAAKPHPVLVTKIDNTASSSPQAGLSGADLVVEEVVEGGVTRLAVFFYSELPEVAGPVRSMRASDIGIVAPVDAAVVTSGAAGVTISRIKEAGIPFFQEGTNGIYRDSSRSAPYNLFANMKTIAEETKQDKERPDDYLPWGEKKDLPKGRPASTLAASFGSHTTNWQYVKNHYENQNTYAADGDEFLADSVLVLRVQIGDAGYKDPAGNFVPETKFEGKGPAMLFHGGRMVRGTWEKDGLTGELQLSTRAGDLKVPAGHTWIELVPAGNGDVTFAK